jgi:hypothetical protein
MKKERASEVPAVVKTEVPRSLAISEQGVTTGKEFASLMSALMSDVIAGRVTPSVGNAACNAGGKLLKVVEMQYKYGTNGPGQGEKVLALADRSPA